MTRVTDYYLIEGKKYKKISDKKAEKMLSNSNAKQGISIVYGERGIDGPCGVCWVTKWHYESWNEDRLFQSEIDTIHKLTHDKEVQDKIILGAI